MYSCESLKAIGSSLSNNLKVTFGVNDIYDYSSDKRNSRKRSPRIYGTLLCENDHTTVLQGAKIATFITLLLATPASIQYPPLLAYTLSFLLLLWAYSSPPFRIKERVILDSLSNGLICWLFWASGYTQGGDGTGDIDKSFHSGWAVFFYASACHSLAAVADTDPDKLAKYRTTAVVYGEKFAAFLSITY
jgi:4-hydroxybenzoate polyprenyltransferase